MVEFSRNHNAYRINPVKKFFVAFKPSILDDVPELIPEKVIEMIEEEIKEIELVELTEEEVAAIKKAEEIEELKAKLAKLKE